MSSGVLKISDLRLGGWDDKAIRAALDAGTLVRITRGWVAHPTADFAVVRAVSKGGRLGCLSGCAHFGLWTPPPGEPHVIVDRGTKRSHPNWHPHYGPLPAEAVFPLTDCLAQVIRHPAPGVEVDGWRILAPDAAVIAGAWKERSDA